MLYTVLAVSLSAQLGTTPAPKARPYDAVHYRLEVKLDAEGSFENKLTLTLKPKQSLREIELDAFGLTIGEATINGQKVSHSAKAQPAQRTGTLTLKGTQALAAGAEAVVEIAYSGKASKTSQSGLFESPDEATNSRFYFTHFQPNGAQLFFPCNDVPEDKATTEVLAVVPAENQVFSNGAKLKDEAFSAQGKNLRRVHWKQEQPHSVYLVALAVGQFDSVDAGGDVPTLVHVPKGKGELAFVATDAARSTLNYLSGFLGTKYPWAKADLVAVPRFIWGGMENTSLVLARDTSLLVDASNDVASRSRVAGLVAHELAHQWFGDYVTLKSWDDSWLNEGFATYFGALAEDNYNDSDLLEVGRVAAQLDYFRVESGPRARSLVGKAGSSPADAFDAVAYVKGAFVLGMLHTWLGDDAFRKGLKAHLEKYAFANATSEDFFAVMGSATKKEKEVRAFKEAWLKKRGFPVVTTQWNYLGGTVTVTVRQRPSHADEKGPFVFKLPVVFHRDLEPSFHEERELVLDKPVVTARFELPAAPQWVNWNKGASALARIDTSAIGEQEWILASRADPDVTWRATANRVLLGALGDPAATEATPPSVTALGALLDCLNSDASAYVRADVLSTLARSRWPRLPADFGKAVLGNAKRPDKLSEDAFGYVLVRARAMEALGKLDFADGHAYLRDELSKPKVDINYLPALAAGTAHVGDSVALATLLAAVNGQKARGYPYFRATAVALGSVATPDVVPSVRELFQTPGNAEILRLLLKRLGDNVALKLSPGWAAFTQEFVLSNEAYGEEAKARVLASLDDVRTPEARSALTVVAEKSESDRLRGGARLVLQRNFPPEAAKPKNK